MNNNIQRNKLYYYGTDLKSAGHYLWNLTDGFTKVRDFDHRDLPFDLYSILRICQVDRHRYPKKGEFAYIAKDSYAIATCVGSCSDTRDGTVTVFFVKGVLTDLNDMMKVTKEARQIANALPFNTHLKNMPFWKK